ncbi:LytR/AlgR family response regulator transcription factor [Phenylobacterium montanum]|uniref:LytTR family transcriptional regulator n=1 Tax=Phenylobacterium montanum TaxID=2823693 RepID=A0A975G4C1_9CAUL|nr:LytTR family DNA-binding domain-containing protein [Caulobacter sp. S6]QUD90338.1 LytTR family transcriptional regulator [Caulobacter sp. S6]
MARVKARVLHGEPPRVGPNVAQAASRSEASRERLAIKAGGVVRFVDAGDIEWIEAADVYVNLHLGDREILHRSALHQVAAQLSPSGFARIHRSIIINLERIKELEAMSHGEFEVVMESGARLRLSRKYRHEFKQKLGRCL